MKLFKIAVATLLVCGVACSTTTARKTEAQVVPVRPATQEVGSASSAPEPVVAPITPAADAAESVPASTSDPVTPAAVATAPSDLPAKPVGQTKASRQTISAGVKTAKTGQPPLPVKPPAAVDAGRITGKLELTAGPRQRVEAGEVAEGLVYFLPRTGGASPKPGRFTMNTHSKGFTPSLLVVPAGSSVSFPNKDEILHNVFSRTPGASFNLGIYGPGQTKSQTFSKAGLVIVNCNVHSSMRANVVVLATPYYTRPGKDGRYELKNLPPGPGTLVFWHPRSAAQTVVMNSLVPVSKRLIATKSPLDSHVH